MNLILQKYNAYIIRAIKVIDKIKKHPTNVGCQKIIQSHLTYKLNWIPTIIMEVVIS